MISIQDFQKVELRVGTVVSAEMVPGADRLLKMEIDLGEAGRRQVVAGIALSYPPESLVGKQLVVVTNLEPATVRGVRSEGMILACGDVQSASVLTVDRPVANGAVAH